MEYLMLSLWNAHKQPLYDAVEHNSQIYFVFRITHLQEITFILFYSQRRVSTHLSFIVSQLTDNCIKGTVR